MEETVITLNSRQILARDVETRKHGIQQFILVANDTLKIETDGNEWLEYSPETNATVTITVDITE